MANYFTLNGLSMWGNGVKPYNNSKNYKDKYFECLMCAGHFQCLHFRHFGVLKLQHVNYRYRKPQIQYLLDAYSTRSMKYYQSTVISNILTFISFSCKPRSRATLFYSLLHKRNLRYLAKAKDMVKTV